MLKARFLVAQHEMSCLEMDEQGLLNIGNGQIERFGSRLFDSSKYDMSN